jgi:iron complex outermembrane receptor protein
MGLSGLIALGAAAPAMAQASSPPQARRFEIPKAPPMEALLEFALQAGVSLGGDLKACGGPVVGLSGRYSLSQALSRLLAASGCSFRFADATTIVIRRSPSPAQSAATPRRTAAAPDIVIGELVVTSGGRADLPGRTPYAITAISSERLEAVGVVDLSAVADQVAGMTVTNFGPGRDKILLRGMSDGAFTGLTQSTVGLYVDHVPVTYNAPDPDLKLVDVEQVEILRGPQGSLYGAGSIGGIVRIVTRQPDLDRRSGGLTLGASFTQSGGLNHELVVTANLPLAPGRLAVRGSAYREDADGYLDDVNLGLKKVNRLRRDGYRVAARLALGPDWALTGGAIHQSINTADTQYGAVNLGPLKRANGVREPHDNDFDERYATLEGQGAWGRLVASSASLSHHLDSRYDASSALPEFAGGSGVAALDDSKDIDLIVNEVVFTSRPAARMRWLVGGFWSEGDSTLDTVLERRTPSPARLYGERRRDKLSERAVYGEGSYDLTDTLTLVAGLRWFRFNFDTASVVSQQGGERRFNGRGHTAGLSPKIAVRYQPDDRFLVYGQISQGYRAGGFNTAGPIAQVFDEGAGQPDHEFDSDEFWNYEVGTKLTLLNDRLRMRVAVFFADWRNIQTDQFLPSGLSYAVNVGDGMNRGVEVEAAWRLAEQWELRLAGLIDDPQLTRRNPAFQSSSDAGLPGVAAASASLAVGYHRRLTDNVMLRLDAQAAYVGTSHLTFDAGSQYQMGDYVSGHLYAAVETRRWTATAFVDNPLDSRANTFAFGNPFRLGHEVAITPQRPRTAGIRLQYRF